MIYYFYCQLHILKSGIKYVGALSWTCKLRVYKLYIVFLAVKCCMCNTLWNGLWSVSSRFSCAGYYERRCLLWKGHHGLLQQEEVEYLKRQLGGLLLVVGVWEASVVRQQHFRKVRNLEVNQSSNSETSAAWGCTFFKCQIIATGCYRLRKQTVRTILRDNP